MTDAAIREAFDRIGKALDAAFATFMSQLKKEPWTSCKSCCDASDKAVMPNAQNEDECSEERNGGIREYKGIENDPRYTEADRLNDFYREGKKWP